MIQTIDRQLVDAIGAFVRSEANGDFNELALAAAQAQARGSKPLQRLWIDHGLDPSEIVSWKQIPALPTLAYKNLDVAIEDSETTFHSSGTSGQRSRHPHAFLDLYRTTIEVAFASLTSKERIDLLSLVPPLETAPSSSLAFMVDHILTAFGSERSAYGWTDRGLDAVRLRSWLGAGQRSGSPMIVIATTLSLVQALERLERFSLRFRLPPGSRIIHTGGSKTETRVLDRGQMLAMITTHVGLGEESVTGEYGMTELTSQFYSGFPQVNASQDAGVHAPGTDNDLFCSPHWVRVRILDPATLQPVTAGTPGLIAVLDLANLSSSVHVLTQDLGVMSPESGQRFQLLGRATGAELRGCSLLTEQLTANELSTSADSGDS